MVPTLDPEIYRRLSILTNHYYHRQQEFDSTATPHYIMQQFAIEFPTEIVLKAVPYEFWKIYRVFQNDPKVIPLIIKEALVSINPPEFKLLGLVRKRPLFWKSIFQIIQAISGFSFELREQEEELSRYVEAAQTRYAGTLDGIYDVFVFVNFPPNIYEYYRGLGYHDRVDFLGLAQYLAGVDVYHSLKLFRQGATKTIKLTTKEVADMPHDLKDRKGQTISREVLTDSQRKLAEALQRDSRSPKRRYISTERENTEFRGSEVDD